MYIILTHINPCFVILKYNNSKIDVDNSYYCCLTARIALYHIRPTDDSKPNKTKPSLWNQTEDFGFQTEDPRFGFKILGLVYL